MSLTDIALENFLSTQPKTCAKLAELGLTSISDLIHFFPLRYQDYTLTPLTKKTPATELTVQGSIIGTPSLSWFGRQKSRLAARFRSVDNFSCQAIWFNQPYLKKQLRPGQPLIITGRFEPLKQSLTVTRTFCSSSGKLALPESLEPTYPTANKIKSYQIQKLVSSALTTYAAHIKDELPHHLCLKYRLLPKIKALHAMHFPRTLNELKQAKRRLIYEELFFYQLKLLTKKRERQATLSGYHRPVNQALLNQFISNLPVTLTKAQERAMHEILADLAQPVPMRRLLHGDVGCGKTFVIAAALYANFLGKLQSAVMVPTEILAEQHYQTLTALFKEYNVQFTLLVGNQPTATKKANLDKIASGQSDIVIGTHALIQEQVKYAKLGLVVTDEEHRFGVKQRNLLRQKAALTPDTLHITATPIPRTLALTLADETEVSTIDELPPGRQPVTTHWVTKASWPHVQSFIEQACLAGAQAYLICPLVKESAALDLANSTALYEELRHSLPELKIGLLHGQLPADEKEKIMRCFALNKLQVLVTTTVIEVGVNVPRATVIVIYDSDRFGLAQLHQLRGRVGRGDKPATCFLIADPATKEGVLRMQTMTKTTDGFEIAKQDLSLRGPGDIFGLRQSGLPPFKIAKLERDLHILACAHDDAKKYFNNSKTRQL
ncbi:MAG: hypothetical protein RLZ12_580 [Bacillota bacterium]